MRIADEDTISVLPLCTAVSFDSEGFRWGGQGVQCLPPVTQYFMMIPIRLVGSFPQHVPFHTGGLVRTWYPGAQSRHHAKIVHEPSFLGNTDTLVHIRVTSVIKAYTFLSVGVTGSPGGGKANLEQPLKKTRIHEFCRACAETHTYVNAQVDTGAWVVHG